MTDATGSFHIVIASLQEDVEPQQSAEALADAIGLEADVAAVILRKAPITLFRDVTGEEMEYVRDHLVELSKAGIDFKITRKPVDDLPKVNWPEKPDLRLLFGDEEGYDEFDEHADEHAGAMGGRESNGHAHAQQHSESAGTISAGESHVNATIPAPPFEAEATCPCCQARLKVSREGDVVDLEMLAPGTQQQQPAATTAAAAATAMGAHEERGGGGAGLQVHGRLGRSEEIEGHYGGDELLGSDLSEAPVESAMDVPSGGGGGGGGGVGLGAGLGAMAIGHAANGDNNNDENDDDLGFVNEADFSGQDLDDDDLPADLQADPFGEDLAGDDVPVEAVQSDDDNDDDLGGFDSGEAEVGVELVESADMPLPEDAFNLDLDSQSDVSEDVPQDLAGFADAGPVDDLDELDTTPEDEDRINSMVQSLESGDDIADIPTLEEVPDLPGEVESQKGSAHPSNEGLTVVSKELQPWSGRARDYRDPNLTKEEREAQDAAEAAQAAQAQVDEEDEEENLEPWTGRARDYVDPALAGSQQVEEDEDEEDLEPWTGRARDYKDPELSTKKPEPDTLDVPEVAEPTTIELEFSDQDDDAPAKSPAPALFDDDGDDDLPELGDDVPLLDEEEVTSAKKTKKTTKKIKKKTSKTKTGKTKKKSTGKTKRLKKKRKTQRTDDGPDVLDELGIDLSKVEDEPDLPEPADDDSLGEELDLDAGFDLDADEGLSLESKGDEEVPALDLKDDLGIGEDDLPAPDEPPSDGGKCTVFLNKIKPAHREKAVELMTDIVGMDAEEAEQLVGRLVVPVAKNVSEERADKILNTFQRHGITGRVRKS